MNHFKKMIQLVKSQGVEPLRGEEDTITDEMFFKAAVENEVFTFEKRRDIGYVKMEHEQVDIDAPFEVFSIEMDESEYALCGSLPSDGLETRTHCVICSEEPGDVMLFFALVHNLTKDRWFVAGTRVKKYYTTLVRSFLDTLNKGVVGQITKREKILTDKVGKKKTHHFSSRSFLVIGSKVNRKKYGVSDKRNIEWDHSVSVRGHWRRRFCPACSSLELGTVGCAECDFIGLKKDWFGKNRKGERIIPGKTWIKHTVKNKDKDPLRKTRKVKTED